MRWFRHGPLADFKSCVLPVLANDADGAGLLPEKPMKFNQLGRRVITAPPRHCARFEAEIIQRLVVTVLNDLTGEQQLEVKANIIFEWGMVKSAAHDVAIEPRWNMMTGATGDEVEKLAQLTFSRTWCLDVIKRSKCRRRRIQRQEKVRPPEITVQVRMGEIQLRIVTEEYEYHQVWSADETACRYKIGPSGLYVTEGAERAATPTGTDDKARFTSMLYGNAAGEMGAQFFILHVGTKSKTDLRTSTTLDNLRTRLNGGKDKPGPWVKKVWSRKLTLTKKSTKRKRGLRGTKILADVDAPRVNRLIPYK